MPNRKATNISEAKLNRLLEYNRNLREQLDIPRITISEASSRYVKLHSRYL
jgi:guanine nucleotide-binding protein subunit gamma